MSPPSEQPSRGPLAYAYQRRSRRVPDDVYAALDVQTIECVTDLSVFGRPLCR